MSTISRHNEAHAHLISWVNNQTKEVLKQSEKKILIDVFAKCTHTNHGDIKNFTDQLKRLVSKQFLPSKKAQAVLKIVQHYFGAIKAAKPVEQPKAPTKKPDIEPSKKQKPAYLYLQTSTAPFSKWERSYPPRSAVDTIGKKGRDKALVFRDDEIKAVLTRSNPIDQKIARTETGKAVLQQQAIRGCTAACTEMLKADHGKEIDVLHMRRTNLGDTERMGGALKKSGLRVKISSATFDTFQDHLAKHGSAIISTNPGSGEHSMILDKVDLKNKTADVRDPYHGWAITVTLGALRRVTGGSSELIQVQR